MKTVRGSLALILLNLAAALPLLAGTPMPDRGKVIEEPCPPDTRAMLSFRTDYTFTGKFRTSREFSGVTRGDSSHQDLEASYRIPLSPITWPGQECGHWYLRVGAEHERYDFRHRGGSLPLPDTLQSIAGVVAFEYLVKGEVAIFLEARPGAYFEHDIHCGTFNVPVKIGTAIPLSKTVYVTLGVAYNAFWHNPVFVAPGIVWLINDRWTLLANAPEPKLIYSPTKELQFWVGGEVTETAFRTDVKPVRKRPRLSGAVVDYGDVRASAGVTFSGFKPLTIDFAAGYAVQRSFDFHRAGDSYRTDGGSPFLKLQFTADL